MPTSNLWQAVLLPLPTHIVVSLGENLDPLIEYGLIQTSHKTGIILSPMVAVLLLLPRPPPLLLPPLPILLLLLIQVLALGKGPISDLQLVTRLSLITIVTAVVTSPPLPIPPAKSVEYQSPILVAHILVVEIIIPLTVSMGANAVPIMLAGTKTLPKGTVTSPLLLRPPAGLMQH